MWRFNQRPHEPEMCKQSHGTRILLPLTPFPESELEIDASKPVRVPLQTDRQTARPTIDHLSSMILPLVVVAYIYTLPESPRWLLRRAHLGDTSKYEKAFLALCELRHTKLQAARDLFLISYQLYGEQRIRKQQKPFLELFTIPRNRHAFTASVIVMFFQQFCGVNVLAYYSSTVLLGAGFSPGQALSASLGFGIINFVFAVSRVVVSGILLWDDMTAPLRPAPLT